MFVCWECVCRDPRGKKHKGWRSCGDGWSEVWTAGCVEDLCADGLRRRAWRRGGGRGGEGGEVAGDRTCSRPLSDPLRRSLVPPSALRPRPPSLSSAGPRERHGSCLKGTPWNPPAEGRTLLHLWALTAALKGSWLPRGGRQWTWIPPDYNAYQWRRRATTEAGLNLQHKDQWV